MGSSCCSTGVEGEVDESREGVALTGDCCAVMEDCLLVEFDAELVVESSASSITLHVCNVASGANDTRLFASDFRLAALRSRIACFSACRFASSSRSRSWVSAFAAFDLPGDCCAMGLNGSATCSEPSIGIPPRFCMFGPGVEKSMRSSSAPFFAGDFPFPVLLLRNSSNEGIAFGGVKGIVGLRIDLIWRDTGVWPTCQHLWPIEKEASTYLRQIAR